MQRLHPILTAALLLSAATAVQAVDYEWTGAIDSDLRRPFNWNPVVGAPPSLGDNALFPDTKTLNTFLIGDIDLGSGSFRVESPLVRLNAGGGDLAVGSLELAAGSAGSAALVISNNLGIFQTITTDLVDVDGQNGNVVLGVGGSRSFWNAGDVSLRGVGTGPSATVSVTDSALAVFDSVSMQGAAQLQVSGGGRLTVSNSLLRLGQTFALGRTDLTVSDAGSRVTVGNGVIAGGNGTGTVTIETGGSLNTDLLRIEDGGSVTLKDAGSSLLLDPANTVVINGIRGGQGSLTVSDAAQLSVGNVRIGYTDTLVTDRLQVTGAGTRVEVGSLSLGGASSGSGGGNGSVEVAAGELSVNDALTIGGGTAGIGTLSVSDAGRLELGGDTLVGGTVDSDGTLTISGVGSMIADLNGGTVTLGGDGAAGLFEIVNGGSFNGGTLVIEDGGVGRLGNVGSVAQLTNQQSLVIDSRRTGGSAASMVVHDAGHLIARDVEIGATLSGKQDKLFIASNARADFDKLYLGNSAVGGPGGNGRVSISDGGRLSVAGTLQFGGVGGGIASVRVGADGRVDVGSDLRLGQYAGSIATLALDGPGAVVDNTGFGTIVGGDGIGILDLGSDGRLSTDFLQILEQGVVGGSGDLATDLLVSGLLSPGNSPGMLNIGGDLVLDVSASTLIEIAGHAAGTQFDQINVAADVTLGGLLTIAFIDSFLPAPGDHFEFLTFGGGISGQFDTIEFQGLPVNLVADLSFDSDSISLVVAANSASAPSPGTLLLMLLGSLVLVMRRCGAVTEHVQRSFGASSS